MAERGDILLLAGQVNRDLLVGVRIDVVLQVLAVAAGDRNRRTVFVDARWAEVSSNGQRPFRRAE